MKNMGGNNSVSRQVTNILTTSTLEVITENTASCTSNSELTQRIRIVAGNNSNITLQNLRMSQNVAVKLMCIAKITTTTETMTQMTNDLLAKISKYSEGLPNTQISSQTKQNIETNIKNEIKLRNFVKNTIRSVQSVIQNQDLDVNVGNGSTFTINDADLSMTMTAITETIQESASALVNTVMGTNNTSISQENRDAPISAWGGAITGVTDSVGDSVNELADTTLGAFSGIFSSGLTFIFFIVFILIVFVAVFHKQIFKLLGMAASNTPAGRVAQMTT